MSQRPEIDLRNYEDVYDYYATSRVKPVFNRAMFAISRLVYKPNVVLSDETRQRLQKQFKLGKGAILAVNHPSQHDPFVAAAAMRETTIPQFQQLMTLAKDSLFRGATRPLFEYTGCMPVFRHKSYDSNREAVMEASNRLFEVAVQHIQQGKTFAITPEGTPSKPDEFTQLKLESIHAGIVRIVLQAGDENSFILSPRHATVAFGEIITSYGETYMDVRKQMYESMQSALQVAIENT